jgi:hypothetical protein
MISGGRLGYGAKVVDRIGHVPCYAGVYEYIYLVAVRCAVIDYTTTSIPNPHPCEDLSHPRRRMEVLQ